VTTESVGRFPSGLELPSELLDLILPSLPGVNADRVKVEALDTIRDLCVKWDLWMRWTDNSTFDAARSIVVVHPPTSISTDDATYAAVHKVVVGRDLDYPDGLSDAWLSPLTRLQVPGHHPGLAARGFTMRHEGVLELSPHPWPGSQALRFLVTLRPRALDVPDWFLTTHAELIRHGVMERIMRGRGPAYNSEMALMHRRAYITGAARGRREAVQGMTIAPSTYVRFLRFGA
jgi:hypothetical protein